MTLDTYLQKYDINSFKDDPHLYGARPTFDEILKYEAAEIDLKIHISKVILCRNFHSSGGIFGSDASWFIECFFKDYEKDVLKPWITSAIKECALMILSGETFSKSIIATTFLFGVIEFYAKHNLGYDPINYDFVDEQYHANYRQMSLGDSILKLKKSRKEIARSLNQVDKFCTNRLKDMCILEKRWTKAKIADRITLSRNTMLHGESHSFYSEGQYMLVLYILFHLHKLKELGNQHL